jgi:DNA-binding transcriptional ArsR family regulator
MFGAEAVMDHTRQQQRQQRRISPPANALVVDGSAAYDFLYSLAAVAAPALYPRWRAWSEEVARGYNEGERRRMRRWFGGSTHALGLSFEALIPLLPEPNGPAELIRVVADLPAPDFLRILATTGPTDPETPLDGPTLLRLSRNVGEARKFADRYLRLSGSTRTNVLRGLADPEGARAELLAVLRAHASLPTVQAVLAETEAERARAAEALRAQAARGVEGLPSDLLRGRATLEGFHPVVVAPSVFVHASSASYMHEIAYPLLDGTDYEPLILLAGTRIALGEVPPTKRVPLLTANKPADPVEHAARTFGLLGEPTRLRLLLLLAQRPHYGQELAVALRVSGAAVSQHIHLLAAAGLVGIERRAKRTYYVLRNDALAAALQASEQYLLDALRPPDES